MGHRTLVPDAGEVVLHELKAVGQSRLVMVLRSTGQESCCPTCGQASRRIHSRYCRHLSDLPWEGIPVGILLQVRRFSCGAEACGQHIFTERLPKTVQRYGRRTRRLSSALDQITLALGGSAGCRLAQQLGILASGSTLLRQLKMKAAAAIAATRVVGIDEWAWRKGFIVTAPFSAILKKAKLSTCWQIAAWTGGFHAWRAAGLPINPPSSPL